MKKKILIGISAFLLLSIVAITVGIIYGKSQGLSMDDMIVKNTESDEETTAQADTPVSGISDEEAMDFAMAELKEKVKNAKPNTSDMVDKIALQARDDAKSIDETKTSEAIAYIHDTYPNYFTDNDVMEKTMYYGYLLDYAYDDNDLRSILGTDAYQVVKYVYRGVETVEDTATQENLKQIEKSLDSMQ
ncbi:hypothetical protein MCG98_16625 [Ruminococcus sp. OA3]|uniref:hypothetical protein n=1 Tax=Ruminococcus sp. OA3 TaxID=2914164 RepID=UPI001F06F781|nr:hypothetical protein [Ruminococcus sp. OA3]MCH1984193.1 hypothetical protein [Ruminococcus sp. OA3]